MGGVFFFTKTHQLVLPLYVLGNRSLGDRSASVTANVQSDSKRTSDMLPIADLRGDCTCRRPSLTHTCIYRRNGEPSYTNYHQQCSLKLISLGWPSQISLQLVFFFLSLLSLLLFRLSENKWVIRAEKFPHTPWLSFVSTLTCSQSHYNSCNSKWRPSMGTRCALLIYHQI